METVTSSSKTDSGGTWRCTYCPLREHYDYKGSKPPFAKHLSYAEDCYIMRDPFSLPNKGEALVLGADCSFCQNPVCQSCSIFYHSKRFCQKCATKNLQHLPTQLHKKIKEICNYE